MLSAADPPTQIRRMAAGPCRNCGLKVRYEDLVCPFRGQFAGPAPHAKPIRRAAFPDAASFAGPTRATLIPGGPDRSYTFPQNPGEVDLFVQTLSRAMRAASAGGHP